MTNKGKNKQQQQSDSYIHDNLPSVQVCTKFQPSRPHSSWQKCDRHFNIWKLERKKNEEIKGQISSSSLIPVYTIHLPTVHVCTKFQSSRPNSSWGKCDENFNVWKLERKKNEGRKGQIRAAAWFRYTRYICQLSTCVPIFNLLGLIVPEKSVTKHFNVWHWRKKNEEIQVRIISSNLIAVYTIQLQCSRVYQVSTF